MTFRVRNLTHTYAAVPGRPPAPALRGVSFDLPPGQKVAVLGPSGSGKSTLLNLLGLLEEKEHPPGTVVYTRLGQETDYHALNRECEGRTALRADAFGFVLQSGYLLPHFTCRDNVAMPLALQGWAADERAAWADTLIAEVDDSAGPALGIVDDPEAGGLAACAGAMPRYCSGGQKQRFAVVRAVAAGPAVLFADEPISNLDPRNSRAVLALMRDWHSGELYRRCAKALRARAARPPGRLADRLDRWADASIGRTLFFVCHHRETARDYSDYFLLLNERHELVCHFPQSEWKDHEPTIRSVLDPPTETPPPCR